MPLIGIMLIFAAECSVFYESMKIKSILIPISAAIFFSGCAHEFNQVYKSQDYAYKYEFAKECFANGKYTQDISLLQ